MTQGTKLTVWISKYALSQGIYSVEVIDCFDISPDMVRDGRKEYSTQFYHGGDWHRTREEAVSRAEQIRSKKIASLKKQIEKLEKRSFAE